MKCLLLAFLVTLCFVFTNIRGNFKSPYLGTDSNRIVSIFNSNLGNKTNGSFTQLLPLPKAFEGHDSELDISLKDTLQTSEEKGKSCLKNVTECMERDAEYKITTDRLSNLLFTSIPAFDISKVNGVSRDCRLQSMRFIEDLKKFKLWALKMYDATAKLPSGLLNGNVNQFGDFDICLAAHSESQNIAGQYCLASMEVQTPRSSYLAGLHQLMQSHHHFKSKLEDPGHRVPRFSSINWALCVPSACSANDVELGLKKTVNSLIAGTEILIRYEVKPEMCQSNSSQNIPSSTYFVFCCFAAFILWELFATFYDFWTVGEKNNWVMAFSIKKNVLSLISLERSAGDIEAIHGVRCLNAILLLLSHKAMALFFQPFTNRTEYVEYVARPFSVLGRAASLYTDPFIMISGTLTTYSLLARLNRTNTMNVSNEYISRLFRILPTFAALIAFCTFILPWLNNGPLWNLVVTHHSEICKQHWWRNMLFIHNYFGFKDMCLTHTHHIGIDTQLFFASPFLIYSIWRWPKKGTVALVSLAIISTIMRYYVTYSMRLSNYVHFGTSIQQLFDTADHMYILPAHRATVYIMGIFLGYILRNYKNLHLTKTQLNIGNTLALFSFCVAFFGPAFMGSIDYVYDPTHAAWYAAVSPILWCHAFAWVIFTWHLGYKGLLGMIFANKFFTLWTKISYTVYLTQFPIYFYNVGITRSAENAGFFRMLASLKEYLWIIVLSAILTLTFEVPFQNIKEILIKKRQNQSRKNSETDKKIT